MTRAGGNIFVRLSTHNTTGSIRKPLIVAEGFDPNILFPEQAYTFRDFLVQLDFDYIANFNRSFNQQLDEIGEYDLVFVDYQNGIDDIRRNAAMVEEVIRRTNQEKNANGSTIGNVVMGLSMGGLVARYALCEMASRGEATQTRLLITHDSPHRGANVPLSLQALVNDLQSLRIYGTRISSIVPDLRKVQDLLNAPASQQLLIIQDGRVNTFLDNEYRAMISRTIPGCRLVASSNGSQCGHGQALQPLGEVLKIESNFYVNWLTWGAAAALGNAALVIVSGVPVVGEAIAAPAALVLNGALLAITPFVGKNYVFNVYCRALPNQQVQQIFSGSLQAQKRFLGLFPLYSVSLWNASRNSTADMLPWDSAPGGVYDLSYIQAQLPGNPNINAFPFLSVNLNINLVGGFDYIPVVSALDITTVNPTSVYAAYNSGTSPVNPSRFDYFIAQEQVNANTFNTDHIQYTPRNSEWMYNEMEGITNTLNCTNECPLAGVTISGPDLVCTTGAYSINPAINGATVTWSTSDPTYLTIDAGSGVATASVDGAVNVVAYVNGCTNTAISKPVRTGGYGSSDYPVTGPSSAQCNQGVAYSTVELPGATNYQWFYPNDWTYVSGQGTRFLTVQTGSNSGQGVVGVRVANACDDGGSPGTLSTYVDCGYYRYQVSPNPAQSQLSIMYVTDGQDRRYPEKIELYNESNSEVVATADNQSMDSMAQTKQVILNVAKLPRGRYVLHVIREQDKATPVDRIHIDLN